MSGKSEMHLFDATLPQIVAESAAIVDINPTTALTEDASTIEFHINGSETEYLDLNDTLLYLRLKVTAAAGKALAAAAVGTPANYFMNSLFSSVTVSLNDTVIEGGNHLYPYKSTIESIFNFDEDTKRIQLRAMGYDESETNRKEWIKESKVFELIGALRLDFFNQPKYLLPGVDVKIRMVRSKSKFALVHGTGDPEVRISRAKLYVRRVKAHLDVTRGINLGLLTKNAIYSYNRGQVVSYAIPLGSLSHYKDNLFSRNLLPKFVVVGFVSASGFSGELEADPFKFDHFNVNSVGLFRDGQPIPYREVYEPNFQQGLYVKEYFRSIVHCTQHLNANLNNGINLDDFGSGKYTLFTFNLTPDFDYTQCQMPRDANLRLEVKFGTPLDKAINVIVYGVFDTQLQITRNRRIITDNVN